MNERRRLKLAARQLMVARIARREAMAALASAVGEELRSAQIATRSRTLASEYGARSGADTGAALRENALFLQSLGEIAARAESAHRDAADQARWQADTLAKTDTRARNLEERRKVAERAVADRKARSDEADTLGLARKLQNPGSTTDAP